MPSMNMGLICDFDSLDYTVPYQCVEKCYGYTHILGLSAGNFGPSDCPAQLPTRLLQETR